MSAHCVHTATCMSVDRMQGGSDQIMKKALKAGICSAGTRVGRVGGGHQRAVSTFRERMYFAFPASETERTTEQEQKEQLL